MGWSQVRTRRGVTARCQHGSVPSRPLQSPPARRVPPCAAAVSRCRSGRAAAPPAAFVYAGPVRGGGGAGRAGAGGGAAAAAGGSRARSSCFPPWAAGRGRSRAGRG